VEQVDAIRDNGFIVLRRVLDQGSMAELRVAFDECRDGHTEHVDVTSSTPHAHRWLELVDTSPFHAIVTELLGADFSTRVHGRNPRPGGGQQGLHADRPAGKSTSVDGVTAIWMLDDFTVDNGATRVVPGTHRDGRAVPRPLAQPLARHPDEVTITGSAGDVLVFDSHLWHSGRRNTSTAPRRSVQMTCSRRGDDPRV
jgi:ectoine hydroxylase-related dioxygenase (phytanoyl-CoA dioxygenase family)